METDESRSPKRLPWSWAIIGLLAVGGAITARLVSDQVRRPATAIDYRQLTSSEEHAQTPATDTSAKKLNPEPPPGNHARMPSERELESKTYDPHTDHFLGEIRHLIDLLGQPNEKMHRELGVYERKLDGDFFWTGAGGQDRYGQEGWKRGEKICRLDNANKVTGVGWRSIENTVFAAITTFEDYRHPRANAVLETLRCTPSTVLYKEDGILSTEGYWLAIFGVVDNKHQILIFGYTKQKPFQETVDVATNEKVPGPILLDALADCRVVGVSAGRGTANPISMASGTSADLLRRGYTRLEVPPDLLSIFR